MHFVNEQKCPNLNAIIMEMAAIFVPKISILLGTDVIIIADLLIFLKHCLQAKHMFNLIVT